MKVADLLEEVRIGEKEYKFNQLIDEIIEDCVVEDELEEGVKYFKLSKRLLSLSDRLDKKASKVPEATELVVKTRAAAKDFKVVEEAFAKGTMEKGKAKAKYLQIKNSYQDVMKALRKKELLTSLKAAGALAIVGGIVATFVFGLGPLGSLAGMAAMKTVNTPEPVTTPFVQAQEALKRAAGVLPGKEPDPTKIFGRGALPSDMA